MTVGGDRLALPIDYQSLGELCPSTPCNCVFSVVALWLYLLSLCTGAVSALCTLSLFLDNANLYNLQFSTYYYLVWQSPTRGALLRSLMECNVIVYNISENATKQQVEEATWVITGERVSRLTAPWTLRCTPISFFYITLVFFFFFYKQRFMLRWKTSSLGKCSS